MNSKHENKNDLLLTNHKNYLTIKKTRFRKTTFASIIIFLPVSALAGTCIQINEIDSDSVMGSGASVPTECDSHSIAIGGGGGAAAKGWGIAIGNKANATGLYSRSPMALGTEASALGDISIAMGNRAKVDENAQQGTAIGASSVVSGEFGMAIGQRAKATNRSYASVAIGESALVDGSFSAALGPSASADGSNTIALGYYSHAKGINSLALGSFASATGNYGVAIGNSAKATGNKSISIGFGNRISGNGSGAIGEPSTVSGSDSYSLGNNNTIGANNAFAIGHNITIPSNLNGAIALGDASTVDASNPTPSTVLNGINYSFAGDAPVTGGVVSVGKAGAERQLTHMAAGRLSDTSTDGVNGSQLFATNTEVNKLGTRMANIEAAVSDINASNGVKYYRINSSRVDASASGTDSLAMGAEATASGNNAVAMGSGAEVQANDSVVLGSGASDNGRGAESYMGKYSGASNQSIGAVYFGNAVMGETRTINNVADGRLANDAVNVRQLDGAIAESKKYTDDSIAQMNAAIVSNLSRLIGTVDETNITALQQSTSDIAQVKNTNGQSSPKRTGNNSLAAGAGAHSSASNSTGLGNGTVAKNNNSVALGASSMADRDNSVSVGSKSHERQITHVAAVTQGTDAVNYDQLKSSLASVGARSNTYTDKHVNNSLAAGAGANSSASNSTELGNGTVAKNNNSVALGASSMADRDNSVSVGSKSHERQITHVAAVTQGTDAVNYDQLKSSLASVGARSNTYTDKHVNNSLAAGTAANSSASKSTGLGNGTVAKNNNSVALGALKSSLASVGANSNAYTNKYVNNSLAAGTAANSSASKSTRLGNGTVAKNSNSVALGASSMVDRNNSVSVGSKGHERQITHVAAATQGTDAVNYDQLKSSLASVGASSNAYTDKRVNQLRDEMARQNKRLSSGIASVIAMANLPQPVDPDASMISMGVGTYHSESGLALGISHRSENERWVTKASVSTNTQGDWSLGIGTGYQF